MDRSVKFTVSPIAIVVLSAVKSATGIKILLFNKKVQ
jgi:hypothetical protein